MHRRTLFGTLGAVFLAGCSSFPGMSSDSDSDEGSNEVRLAYIEFTNYSTEDGQLEAELSAEGTVVYEATRTVPAESVEIAERQWPATAAQFTLHGRGPHGDTVEYVYDEPHAETCWAPALAITGDGGVDIYRTTAGAPAEEC